MKNIYIAFLLFSSLVVSIPLYAMPFGESNIIVSGDNMLFEYSVEGQIVQQIPTPPIPDFTQIRDLIVTASGEVAIFNGTSDPELNLYNPQTEEWRSFKFPGWSIVNNDSNGGIAAYGDGIYVTDMMADGNGIIRFGLDGTAQRVLEGKDYVDLTLGLDGKFYALKENTSFVDIIDPELMQVIRTVQLEFAIDVRGIAVNSSGYIYTVSWNGEFAKYDSNGTQWISMPGAGSINLVDIDIDAQGRIVFHDRNNILYLTNELFVEQLISPQAINLPVVYSASSFVAFSKNDAIVQTNPNVLVSSDNRMFEYTPAGQLINEITIPSTDQVRDLI
ncbi:MAG: hypothetical protein OQK58_13370, partial [Gammaproteobacteria bacterium]|nr:hypothetical protein [Gammaproteobacteria bacterium]